MTGTTTAFTSERWRQRLAVTVALILVLGLGLALRLVLRCGLSNPDSYAYVAGASRLNEDGIAEYLRTIDNIYENRLSIVFPLALSFRAVGLSEASMSFLPLVYSLAAIIVTFLLGQQLYDIHTGLLAGLLVAIIPMEVYYSTAVLPDSLIPLYIGFTLLCFVIGQKRNSRLAYMLAGIGLFLAFQARATSGILIVPLLLAAWWSPRRTVQGLVLPGLTFVALIAICWSILYLTSGDFFLQFHFLVADATNPNWVGAGRFATHIKRMLAINGDFGLLHLLAFPMTVYFSYKGWKDEAYRLPVLAFVGLYLFFEFGSTTLTTYQPIWKLGRFLSILSIPAALIVARVTILVFSKNNYWLRLAMFSLLTAHLFLSLSLSLFHRGQTQINIDHNYPFKTVFQNLSDQDQVGAIAIVDYRWRIRGQVYARLHGKSYEYQSLKGQHVEEIQLGTVVIYDPISFTPDGENTFDPVEYPSLDSLPEQPPDNWRLLYRVDRPLFESYPVYVYLVE